MDVVAFIPARGGSQSIPQKNIKDFFGRPLIYWNISELEKCESIKEIVVATDSSEITDVVSKFEFSKVKVYRRSADNAQHDSSTESAMLEYIGTRNWPDDQKFMLVQCTSPFTKRSDFEDGISQFEAQKLDALLSCARVKRFFWSEDGQSINYDFRARPRRQDFDGTLMENGAFYLSKIGLIKSSKNRISGNIGIYAMPEYSMLELDELDDWVLGEKLMAKYFGSEPEIAKPVRLFLSDIDGVLTDSGMYYSENGDELKKFSTYDGMAFQLLKESGIQTGLVTSEERNLNKRRATKIKVDHFFQGAKNKLEIVDKLCEQLGVHLSEVAYIGDDINDLDLLKAVGVAACPKNARQEIKDISGIIHLDARGGEGVVREFAELIMKNQS